MGQNQISAQSLIATNLFINSRNNLTSQNKQINKNKFVTNNNNTNNYYYKNPVDSLVLQNQQERISRKDRVKINNFFY